jgi:hypothetical protein
MCVRVARDCQQPNIAALNTVTAEVGTTYLDTRTYSCKPGYTGTGDRTIACRSDGTWTALALTCAGKEHGPH